MPLQPCKRPKLALLNCPEELHYEENEIINVSRDERQRGASCNFDKECIYEEGYTDIKAISMHIKTSVNFQMVLNELNRPAVVQEKRSKIFELREGQAFRRTSGNSHQSQYYLKTTEAPYTVTHINSGDRFWGMDEPSEIEQGTTVYTNGFLWCNTSPNWMWTSRYEGTTLIRCRIEVPVGTQVVVDRSPANINNMCKVDEERTSIFPDVLLPPGQFTITSVQRYTDKCESGAARGHSIGGRELRDEEYAARMLLSDNVSEFVDVRLTVNEMLRMP